MNGNTDDPGTETNSGGIGETAMTNEEHADLMVVLTVIKERIERLEKRIDHIDSDLDDLEKFLGQ